MHVNVHVRFGGGPTEKYQGLCYEPPRCTVEFKFRRIGDAIPVEYVGVLNGWPAFFRDDGHNYRFTVATTPAAAMAGRDVICEATGFSLFDEDEVESLPSEEVERRIVQCAESCADVPRRDLWNWP